MFTRALCLALCGRLTPRSLSIDRSPTNMPTSPKSRPIATASTHRLLSTILTEIKTVRAEIKELKTAVPSLISEQLQRQANARKLVIYGIPEDASRDQVSNIFSLVGIPSDAVSILSHLGKPRLDGKPRPICVEISPTSPFPHLITLASRLSSITAFKHYSVRRLETPEQRREGYLARQARRSMGRDQTTKPAPSPDQLEVARGLESSVDESSSSDDSEPLQQEAAVCPDPVSFDDLSNSDREEVMSIITTRLSIASFSGSISAHSAYSIFRNVPSRLKKAVSDVFFEKTKFRLKL